MKKILIIIKKGGSIGSGPIIITEWGVHSWRQDSYAQPLQGHQCVSIFTLLIIF